MISDCLSTFIVQKNRSEIDPNDIIAHVVVIIVVVWKLSYILIRVIFMCRYRYSYHSWCERTFIELCGIQVADSQSSDKRP